MAIRPIVKDIKFLSQKSEPATKEDAYIIQDLMDTLKAHDQECIGIAANMIGYKKRIIVVSMGSFNVAMINPEIIRKEQPYTIEEGCLCYDVEQKTKRYMEIEVKYLDATFHERTQVFNNWIAQVIQHEIDHCDGILI